MSEPGGTESTGFTAPAQPVTPDQAQQATADQVSGIAANLGQDSPAADQAQLGAQVAAGGAQADEVDVQQLLRGMQAMQARIDALEAEKSAGQQSEIERYTSALADHLQVHADQHPGIHSDPDHTFMPSLERAAQAANTASDGNPADVLPHLDFIERWVTRHGRRYPGIDYSYVLQLVN